MSLLEAKNIKKVYKTRFGGASVEALRNVSFTVEKGEYVAIMGESGSGKTTLLNILAALDKATEGTVILDGMDLTNVKDKDVARFRRDNLGYVFQEFNLLDTFTIEDNIYLPLVLAGKRHQDMSERLSQIAPALGITRNSACSFPVPKSFLSRTSSLVRSQNLSPKAFLNIEGNSSLYSSFTKKLSVRGSTEGRRTRHLSITG